MDPVDSVLFSALQSFENNLTRKYGFGCTAGEDVRMRQRLADELVQQLKRHTNLQWDGYYAQGSDEEQRSGFVDLGQLLTQDQLREIRDYLLPLPLYDSPTVGDSDGIARSFGEAEAQVPLAGYCMKDILAAPHLLETANHPRVIGTLEAMMRCPPVLTFLQCWWAFPRPDEPPTYLGQNFHRDPDGLRNNGLFVYLTDVDDGDSGPHQYIKNTAIPQRLEPIIKDHLPLQVESGPHRGRIMEDVYSFFQDHGDGLNDLYQRYLADQIHAALGPAGTAFVTDTFGLHRGLPPRRKPRLVFVVRYGVTDNVNADHRKSQDFLPWPWEKVAHRLPDTFNSRYLNRPIIK